MMTKYLFYALLCPYYIVPLMYIYSTIIYIINIIFIRILCVFRVAILQTTFIQA